MIEQKFKFCGTWIKVGSAIAEVQIYDSASDCIEVKCGIFVALKRLRGSRTVGRNNAVVFDSNNNSDLFLVFETVLLHKECFSADPFILRSLRRGLQYHILEFFIVCYSLFTIDVIKIIVDALSHRSVFRIS